MPIRAEHDPGFYRRFWYMGIVACGFALWCLYDAVVAYPSQRERALALQQLITEKRVHEWDEVARQHGWPANTAGLDKPREEAEIGLQYVMAGISAAVGLFLISLPIRARGRWIEAVDEGLTSSWGEGFRYDQIVALNKRAWRKKGIARITYRDNGGKRRFVLDDYKFDRHATDAILFEIEQRIDPALVTGGPLEPSAGEHDEPAPAEPAV